MGIRLNKFKNPKTSLSKAGLLAILKNKNIIKCGVGIIGDRDKLYNDYRINIERCIELNHVYFRYKSVKCIGLKKLCEKVLHFEMKYKSKKITMSNWENKYLSENQIFYAAEDALIGYQIFDELIKNNNQMCSIHTFLQNIEDYINQKPVSKPQKQHRIKKTNKAPSKNKNVWV